MSPSVLTHAPSRSVARASFRELTWPPLAQVASPVDRVSASDRLRVGATSGDDLAALTSVRHAPWLPSKRLGFSSTLARSRGPSPPHARQGTRRGRHPLHAIQFRPPRSEVWTAGSRYRCSRTEEMPSMSALQPILVEEHPVAAAILDLPMAGPDPSSRSRASAARAAGSSRSSRAATRRGRRVGLG